MSMSISRLLLVCALTSATGASAAPARDITPRTDIVAAVRPGVPQHGIYAAGGGLTSSAWRIVVDFDANTIYIGSNDKSGSSSIGKLPKEKTKKLSPADRDRLRKLAEAAWTEKVTAAPPHPQADYDELLIVGDGKDTFYLDGYGPIRRKAAAAVIDALRKL
jgi:hypothetical protein